MPLEPGERVPRSVPVEADDSGVLAELHITDRRLIVQYRTVRDEAKALAREVFSEHLFEVLPVDLPWEEVERVLRITRFAGADVLKVTDTRGRSSLWKASEVDRLVFDIGRAKEAALGRSASSDGSV